ncbi:MAG: hypothetical protein RIQ81_218 [Pseudomonadota bacterium]
MNDAVNQDRSYWSGRWQNQQTGWDLGGPHEGLARLLRMLDESGVLRELMVPGRPLEVYSPGCGRAHDGAAMVAKTVKIPEGLCANGIHVTATDFAPEAIAAAKEVYGALQSRGLTLRVEDARAPVPPAERGKYDIVFDRAMLCALRPELRAAYLDACRDRLRPGGVFLTLPFTKTAVTPDHPVGAGPPFEITIDQLKTLLARHNFNHVASELFAVNRPGTVILEESLAIFRA